MTDPIADLLTRIKNAVHTGHDMLTCPRSNLKVEMLSLQSEGFIESFKENKTHIKEQLILFLVIEDALSKLLCCGIKRVSKPSRRVYVKELLHYEMDWVLPS